MKVLEIGFVGYPVTDLKRARGFYEGVLGLEASRIFEQGGMGWIEYDIGPGTLAIGSGMPGWEPSPQGGTAALEVDDFDAAVEHLRKHGVAFAHGPEETPVCRMGIIQDPDGNSLIVHKRKPGHE